MKKHYPFLALSATFIFCGNLLLAQQPGGDKLLPRPIPDCRHIIR